MKLTKRKNPHFRETDQGLLLIATKGASDALPQFPPREFLHGRDVPEEVVLGPVGTLYTYSVVHPGKDAKPYGLAMVDFEPGVRVFGRLILEEGAQPALGSAIRVVPFQLADGTADYAFQPEQGGGHE